MIEKTASPYGDGPADTGQRQTSPESAPVAAAETQAMAPLLVSDIEAVARSRRLTVAADALLVEVAALLSGTQISVVVVCDAAGSPLGTITETVLVRQLGLGQADFFSTRAATVMSPEFTVCASDDRLSDVLATMHSRGLIQVLLVDASNRLLGVVNARDGLRALLAAGNYEEAQLRNYVMGIGYQ
ncbi:MAG: CBS domain-containing protein [Microbacteriaceae bacterium]|nr:CBS domain-containing protein [Burkholderiaceae bacterium]